MPREDEILSIVSQRKKIEVNELAQLLNVSKVTMRKDLDKLEEKGILHRQHGYAVLNNEDDINYRLAYSYNIKKKIAQAAAQLIEDGEVLMIESGSTCAILADEIANTKKDVTIITNSCFIASYVRKSENVKIILLGGEYQKNSQVNTGPLVHKVVGDFRVKKLFAGIDSIDFKRGFIGTNIDRIDATRAMASSADEIIILTDAEKFKKNGTFTEFSFDEVSKLFTDKSADSTVIKQLNDLGIDVVAV